jgi:hypothetical protein
VVLPHFSLLCFILGLLVLGLVRFLLLALLLLLPLALLLLLPLALLICPLARCALLLALIQPDGQLGGAAG